MVFLIQYFIIFRCLQVYDIDIKDLCKKCFVIQIIIVSLNRI